MEELKVRYVVKAKLLGQDKEARKKGREKEYAIQVTLSEESQYTMFRTLKDITMLQSRMMSQFPVEAGYFKKKERVIPECPVKQTIFGIQRVVSDDKAFEKLLNSYIKEIPALPAAIVKCELVTEFFSLRASDIQVPGSPKSKPKKKKGKKSQVIATEDSEISGPMSLKSYYAVASYSDKKFKIAEGAVVLVMKKDPGGWWMVDNSGSIGWAPASYLVPVDQGDLGDEDSQEQLEPEKFGARYISVSSYQASRDDELSFVRGAVVKVIKRCQDGWWLVRYNGGEGYVPGALFKRFDKRQATVYVKKIRRNFINRRSTKIVPTIKPKWMGAAHTTRRTAPAPSSPNDKPQLALYQAKAVFEGDGEKFQLSISKNDNVKVLDKQDHGWWYVEDQHGRSGWVPATYLRPILDNNQKRPEGYENITGSTMKVLQAHRSEQPDELTVSRGESVEVIMVTSDGWWIVRNNETAAQGLVPSLCLTQEPDPAALESSPPPLDDHSTSSDSQTDTWGEADTGSLEDLDEARDELDLDGCFIATSDYSRQSMDELDLYEGQVVCVIDDSDNDVWYVNSDGKEGWVPADLLKEYEEELSGESSQSSAVASSADESEEDIVERRRSRSTSPGARRSRAISHSQMDPHLDQLRAAAVAHKRLSPEPPSEPSTRSSVKIMVDDRSLEELEREVKAAEKRVQEAQVLAAQLKLKANYARRISMESGSS